MARHITGVPGGPRRALWLAAGALVALVLVSPLASQGQQPGRRTVIVNGHEAAAGEVLVKLRATAEDARPGVEARANADESETAGRSGVRRLHSRTLETTQLLDQLRTDPSVEYAEPNYVVYGGVTPNDSSFAALWGLLNTGFNTYGGGGTPGSDIDAASAWTVTGGSRANVVGVVDTGIDYLHPDLAANIWAAPGPFSVSIAGQVISCQAGTHGFNAITRTCDPMDDAATPHGTHVSGTIGAVGNNSAGVVGVNWTASLMGLKFLNQNGSGYTSDAINAIEFAIQAKAAFASTSGANVRVLSNSWGGGGFSRALLDEVNAANTNQMLFVAAAGNSHSNNDTSPAYPASYATANMVAVAATDSKDALASFSNYGQTSVHLGAPGVSIYSTGSNNTYLVLSGTSMATPHVAGAAALALAMCSVTTSELKSLLLSNVDLVSGLATVTSTGGRLNVGRAVQNCPKPLVTSVSINADKAAPQSPGATVTWTASASGGQAPYQYRWFVFDGATWSIATNWSSSATFQWTPSTQNAAYQVQARARSAWNSGSWEALASQPFVIMPVVTSVSTSADKAAPQGVGTTVTWTASATGGQAPYQYRWFIYDGATWTIATPWSTSNTFQWTPPTANAAYQVQARARSGWNTGTWEALVSQPFAIMPIVTSVAIAPDKSAPQNAGTPVTWTASAAGGQAPYQYRWFIYDGSSWTIATPWNTSNTFQWTPSTPNEAYQVQARARSAWNTGAWEALVSQPFAIR